MFRVKTLDTITLFHKAASPSSTRLLAALKTASEKAASGASGTREQFQLEVTEDAPTLDQLRCIMDYLPKKPAAPTHIIRGADTAEEAFKKFKQSPANFVRPVVVDWNRGKAIAGENESEVLKMLADANK